MAAVSFFKYIAIGGYVTVYLLSSSTLTHMPSYTIAAGITLLSLFEAPLLNFIFNWSLYSLLVYMLISYHEMDGCILDKCEQTQEAALVSIISTIVAWGSIGEWQIEKADETEKVIKTTQPKRSTSTPPITLKSVRLNVKEETRQFPKLHWV